MNIWSYRGGVATTGSMQGFDVEARDGHIGSIEEHSSDAGRECLVVDTGPWIFGKKRVIPSGVIERVDPQEKKVYISMSKDEVKAAPDWRDDWRGNDAAWNSYGDYYEPFGW